jgi:hypothetical protein
VINNTGPAAPGLYDKDGQTKTLSWPPADATDKAFYVFTAE